MFGNKYAFVQREFVGDIGRSQQRQEPTCGTVANFLLLVGHSSNDCRDLPDRSLDPPGRQTRFANPTALRIGASGVLITRASAAEAHHAVPILTPPPTLR